MSRNGKFIIRMLLVLGAAMILLRLGAAGANAAALSIEVSVTGADEVPAVSSPLSAKARFGFDEAARHLTYAVTVSGVSPDQVSGAQLRRGSLGVSGPVVRTLASAGFTQISGVLDLTDGEISDIKNGNLYVNVTSPANPGGAARGQVLLPAAQVFRQFSDALNRGDVAATMSFFTDDAVVEHGPPDACAPPTPCAGKDSIQKNFVGDLIDAQARFTILGTAVSGDTVTVRQEVRGNMVRRRGFDRIIAGNVVTVSGNKISRIRIDHDVSDPQTAALQAARLASIQPPNAGDGGLLATQRRPDAWWRLGAVGFVSIGSLLIGVWAFRVSVRGIKN